MIEPPENTDSDAWKQYWEAQDQPWRTEPEIDGARKAYLAERYSNKRETSQGAHPFAGVRLDRADIEWMLAQYHAGDWIDATWTDNHQTKHKGLDFYGVDVSNVNLNALPLQYASFFHAQMQYTKIAPYIVERHN